MGTKHKACTVFPQPSSRSCIWSPCMGTVALTLQTTDDPPPVFPGGCVTWLVWTQLPHCVPLCLCPHLLLPPLAGTDPPARLPALDFGSLSEQKDSACETTVSPWTDGHWKPLLQGKPSPTTPQQDGSPGPCLVADVRGTAQVGACSPLCVATGAAGQGRSQSLI